MKKAVFKLLVFLAVPLAAENFDEILRKIDNALIYKISKNDVLLAKKTLQIAKSLNYGKIDLNYVGVKFFETPKMKMTTITPVAVAPDGVHLIYKKERATFKVGENTHFIGEIKYSYPIFTGYKIHNTIEAAKIEYLKSKLKLKNTKRVLILNAAKLYSGIYALNSKINALIFEKKALKDAKEKAIALFEQGLIDMSGVDEINAKYYETIADIEETKSKRDNLLNILSNLINYKVDRIEGLKNYTLNKLRAQKRPDVLMIYKNLNLADINIKINQSSFYPSIAFEAGLKREADNVFLSKNKHQNIDNSYLSLGLNWNIFNGGSDKQRVEIAKIKKLNAYLFYNNYLNEAKTELKNDLREIKALKIRLKAANNEIKARSVYYEKIKSKFEEGLADSVDLNNAIAMLAAAKAKKEYIKSQIFFFIIKTKLDGGEEINLK